MKSSKSIFLIGLLAILSVGFVAVLAPINYKIKTEEAEVGFVIKNLGLNVDGTFSGLSGSISFDKENPSASKIEARIPVKSVDTGINKRDEHLRSEDYFEVDKYPNISFSSTSIKSTKEGYTVRGNFTIKATTKEVSIPFSFDGNNFVGKFSIDRRDYGVGGNSMVMGDKVKISFKIPVSAM